jgi:ribosomal protein L40E
MITVFWFIIFIIVAVIVSNIMLESYRFNNGICRKCGNKLTPRTGLVDGQIIYECKKCHNTVTISGRKV